jgi:hypothetical protein
MPRSLPALLMVAQRDPVISALPARFVQDRCAPIVERLEAAIAAGQISPDADPDLLVDLLSGPIVYRQLLRRERTSDVDVRAIVASVLASAGARG